VVLEQGLYIDVSPLDVEFEGSTLWWSMSALSIEEIREELNRLMLEHVESMKKQTFVGLSEEEYLQQEKRLMRIREVSADFLAALKRSKA